MTQAQPITLDEQEHYLATRQVTRGVTRTPKKHRGLKAEPALVAATLATFGTPTNLPGFKYPIGTKVRTTNGGSEWLVVAQSETPHGTEPRSYKVQLGKMSRVLGESALRPIEEAPTKMIVIDVRLNKSTGQIEPVSPATATARQELKSMLVASVAPTLAPSIDEPALFTVEPVASRFAQSNAWVATGRASKIPSAQLSPKAQAPRKNAPFAPTAVITVLVANPKKPGSASHKRFALYVSGQSVAEAIASGVTMADLKWDAAHKFIKVD